MKIEEVSKTKYLGTTVTKDNLIEEEIEGMKIEEVRPNTSEQQ